MHVRMEGKDQAIALEGPLLGRGGEASIYAVPGRTDLAAKIYHNPTDEQASKLEAMLAAPPVAPPSPGQHVAIAWPIGRLLGPGDEGGVIGYLMPRIDDAHLIWEVYNPGVRRAICPHFHQGSLLRTARNLAAGVRTLHECGYVLGDLNESNVLVTAQGLVTLLDVDSFQVPGRDRLYRCRVGRPDYTPPELQGVLFAEVDRSPEHDAFALAVLIFQLLMQGVHPFAGIGGTGVSPVQPGDRRDAGPTGADLDSIPLRIGAGSWPYAWQRTGPIQPSPHAPPWFVLPPSVQELLCRCFEDAHAEPDLRPGAAQWQHALEEAEHELRICPANGQHVFHRGLDCCPWCTLVRTRGRDAFPAPEEARSPQPARAPSPQRKMSLRRTEAPSVRVDDPLPPQPMPPPRPTAVPGWTERSLQAIGAGVERRDWIVWIGVALIGAVAGFLYALQHALPVKTIGP